MKLRSTQPKIISLLLEVLKENITDVLLHFHPDSIKLRAADHGKTNITYVNLVGNKIDEYRCDKYQPVGINVAKLWAVLKIANAEDILQMDFEDGQQATLNISVMDSKTNNIKFRTGYITYDTDEEALAIPESISFDSCISMSSHRLYTDLKYLESLESEYVALWRLFKRRLIGAKRYTF